MENDVEQWKAAAIIAAEDMLLYPPEIGHNPAGAAEIWIMARRMANYIKLLHPEEFEEN